MLCNVKYVHSSQGAWDTCIHTHGRAVTHSKQSESFPIQTFIARLDRGNPNRQSLLMPVYGHFKIQFLIFSSEYDKQAGMYQQQET